MAKDALFNSNASALLAAFLLAGCAHSARELPPDMSNLHPAHRLLPGDTASPEYSLSCPELQIALVVTRAALSRIETSLQGIHADNQSKAIVGLIIFSPVMLAMEGNVTVLNNETMVDNATMQNQYRELDIKREHLLRIAQVRQCPS